MERSTIRTEYSVVGRGSCPRITETSTADARGLIVDWPVLSAPREPKEWSCQKQRHCNGNCFPTAPAGSNVGSLLSLHFLFCSKRHLTVFFLNCNGQLHKESFILIPESSVASGLELCERT
jgi:hypothetical protein